MKVKIYDRIRTRTIEYFNDWNINLKYDSIASTFSLRYYFDPDNFEQKELSCVGHYHICSLEHNDELVLKGMILSIAFKDSPFRQLVPISGYSLPGILEDCEITTSATPSLVEVSPLQFDQMNLLQIAQQLTAPYGINIQVDPIVADDMNQLYEESTARPSENIKHFLAKLASQRNIVMSHTPSGDLLFTRISAYPQPQFHFDAASPIPGTEMELSFNGQGVHSHITVMTQSDIDGDPTENPPLKNPYVINTVYRPKVIIQNSKSIMDNADLAARNARAQELKNLHLTIHTDRWIINNKIIRPGMAISVTNPRIYLYKKSNWIIEEVDLTGDAQKTTAVLKCVLPEVFNGQDPTYLFQGINLH